MIFETIPKPDEILAISPTGSSIKISETESKPAQKTESVQKDIDKPDPPGREIDLGMPSTSGKEINLQSENPKTHKTEYDRNKMMSIEDAKVLDEPPEEPSLRDKGEYIEEDLDISDYL